MTDVSHGWSSDERQSRRARNNADAETVGAELRLTRLKADLSIEEVSARTRIKEAHLRALEDMNVAALPGRTYALGYLRSYAEFLGFDVADTLARFKQESAIDKNAKPVKYDFFEPGQQPMSTGRGASIFIVLMLMFVAVFFFWRIARPTPEAGERLSPNSIITAIFGESQRDRTPAASSSPDDEAPAEAAVQTATAAIEPAEDPILAEGDVGPPEGSTSAAVNAVEQPSADDGDGAASDAAAPEAAAIDVALLDEPVVGGDEAPEAALDAPEGRQADEAAADSADAASVDAALIEAAVPIVEARLEESDAAASEPGDAADDAAPADPPADPLVSDVGEAETEAASDDVLADVARFLSDEQQPSGDADEAADAPAAERRAALDVPIGVARGASPDDARVVVRALIPSTLRIVDSAGSVLVDERVSSGDLFYVPNAPGARLTVANAGGFDIFLDGANLGLLGGPGEALADVSLDPRDISARSR